MNRLQVEWNNVERPYPGFPPWPFYRVIVDGQTLTDCAHPFGAGDDLIIMRECDHCGYCGLPSVEVRRYGDQVYWYGHAPESRGGDPWFDAGEFRAFDRLEYETALGRGRTDDLPQMCSDDVHALTRALSFPDWRDGLYTFPDLDEDLQGRVALRELWESFIADRHDFFVVPAATRLRLRIGLELPGTPEAIYEIGDDDGKLAVKLVALPTCPVWITGPALATWAAKMLAVARSEGGSSTE